MKQDGLEASPMKAVLEELDKLQSEFRETLESYSKRMESEIKQIHDTVHSQIGEEKVSNAKLRDLRDILTLLRNVEVRAQKGRRKDLKKIDSLVGDLAMLVENW